MGGGKAKMLSVSEVAQKIGAAKRSVQMWARMERFRGAKHIDTPGRNYWPIPESALDGFEVRGRGRPPKPKPATEKTA